MTDYRSSAQRGTLALYDVVMALALTASLRGLFGADRDFSLPSPASLMVWVAFMTYAVRFFLGAHMVMEIDYATETHRLKIVLDVVILWIQAVVFFVASLNDGNVQHLQIAILALLTLDSIWLGVLDATRLGGKIIAQWSWSNGVLVAGVLANMTWCASNIWVLAVMSTAALFQDIKDSWGYYWGLDPKQG